MKKFSIQISVIALLLFVTHIVLAEDQKNEISVDEAVNYYCHTWINHTYFEDPNISGIKRMNKDGTFEWYSNEANEAKEFPSWSGKFIIVFG